MYCKFKKATSFLILITFLLSNSAYGDIGTRQSTLRVMLGFDTDMTHEYNKEFIANKLAEKRGLPVTDRRIQALAERITPILLSLQRRAAYEREIAAKLAKLRGLPVTDPKI